MATTFKTLTANDIVNTRTILHEAIPLTGTISSGTYTDLNIKKYSHGMFESVYDYPYLSSSANHIYDITVGFSSASVMSASTPVTQQAKKINVYTQMAQVLMGYNSLGEVQEFDQDGNLSDTATSGQSNSKMREVFFINFARLLGKDELKKGSFQISFITGGAPSAFTLSGQGDNILTLGDYSATSSYYVNSPAGEYGILYTSSVGPNTAGTSGYGLLFYQAGIAVVTGAIWANPSGEDVSGNKFEFSGSDPDRQRPAHTDMGAGIFSSSFLGLLTGSGGTIEYISDSIRNRIQNISFNNTVELNSTIYFCRANHNEFNYSSNPTYLTASQIRVKSTTSDNPVSYITTVGLYSSDNELLAVAKLSEPLKKDPNTELTLRVRLDY